MLDGWRRCVARHRRFAERRAVAHAVSAAMAEQRADDRSACLGGEPSDQPRSRRRVAAPGGGSGGMTPTADSRRAASAGWGRHGGRAPGVAPGAVDTGSRRNGRMAKSAVASGTPAIKPLPGKGGSDPVGQDLIASSPALKRLLVQARERGVVTVDEINAALPEEEVSPDQLDELIAMFEEMGVSVGRERTAATAPRPQDRARGRRGARARAPPRSTMRISAAPTTRCACICARWARSSCSRARARSRSPSASRPGATPCSRRCARAR